MAQAQLKSYLSKRPRAFTGPTSVTSVKPCDYDLFPGLPPSLYTVTQFRILAARFTYFPAITSINITMYISAAAIYRYSDIYRDMKVYCDMI